MLKIFDSLKGEICTFETLEKGKVKMYVCGPTVYDRGHLGHGRSAVAFDIVHRYLEFIGYDVTFVMNITDIDDKMIQRANDRGITVKQLTEEITPLYMSDYKALGVKESTINPHATDYVAEMIEMISVLEGKGHVYVLNDGVYFDVSTFAEYGKLSKQNLEALQTGSRIAVKDDKRTPHDFVLWKFEKPGEPSWQSPWGKGRPGWHIECSAMTRKTLGESGFDIHGGGLDLKFPHHECEIAQTEGAYGVNSFARFWMHNGFINVESEKMSKSLNNFFTLEEAFKRYHPQVIRMFYLQTHYRDPINFSIENLDGAKNALESLHIFSGSLSEEMMHVPDSTDEDYLKILDAHVGDDKVVPSMFVESMNNDFNVPQALSVVFNLRNEFGKRKISGKLSKSDVTATEKALRKMDTVLGVIFARSEDTELTPEELELIEARNGARKNRDFQKSDELRDLLLEKGVILEDTPTGTIARKKL